MKFFKKPKIDMFNVLVNFAVFGVAVAFLFTLFLMYKLVMIFV